jgi:hypothetical protein
MYFLEEDRFIHPTSNVIANITEVPVGKVTRLNILKPTNIEAVQKTAQYYQSRGIQTTARN